MSAISSIFHQVGKTVVNKIVSGVVGLGVLVGAGLGLSALKSGDANGTPASETGSNVMLAQAPGGAPSPGTQSPAPAPAPASDSKPSTVSAAAGGGIVVEYQDSYGGGGGSPTVDSQEQAQNFVSEKGWSVGENPNGMVIFIGKASLRCSPQDGKFDDCRVQAYHEAMFKAKRGMVEYLAAKIAASMSSNYAEGDFLKRAAEDRQRQIAAEPSMMQKALALADGVITKKLEEQGIKVGPGADTKAWSEEQKKKAEDLARKEATSLVSKREFKSATEVLAAHEVAGIQAYRTFEQTSGEKNGNIAVVAIYSPKSLELQQAMLGLRPMPTGMPKEPISKWARAQGNNTLLYTFGMQPRTNESGEVVLVCFGQATPITKSESSMDAAESKAQTRAQAEARRFLGEMVMAQKKEVQASTLKEFADDAQIYQSESSFNEAIEATAKSLSMPGGIEVYSWKAQHPLSDRQTAGSVYTFSVSGARKAAALGAVLDAAAASQGGAGITGRPPPQTPPAQAPKSTPKPKTGDGSGAGAQGEEP